MLDVPASTHQLRGDYLAENQQYLLKNSDEIQRYAIRKCVDNFMGFCFC